MQSQYKFLLVSRQDEDAQRIVTEIERNKLYHVDVSETAEATTARLGHDDVNCLVYNVENFTPAKCKLVTNVRDLGHAFPILVFSNIIDPVALEFMRKMAKIVVIEKPFEPKDVWGICEKLLQGRKVHQRIFRRFYTFQKANMERTVNGETVVGDIMNLSRGGAYVEMNEARFLPGELLKVRIPLDKISKSYHVDAEVVWATPKSPQGANQGTRPAAGLRFIKSGDVYRNLLKQL